MNEWASLLEDSRLFNRKGYRIVLDEILAMPLTLVMSFPDELACEVIAESEKRIAAISTALVAGKITTINPPDSTFG